MIYTLDELLRVAFQGILKGGVTLHILAKALLFCPLFLAGCANRESMRSPLFPARNLVEQSGAYSDKICYWGDTRSGGKPRIAIDLKEQRAYFYRGNKMVGISVVSTGRQGYKTPSGEFRVIEKDATHASSIYGDYVTRSGRVVVGNVNATKDSRPRGTVFRGAPMPYFLRIQGGIGMHAGYLPGYPASHGCIRLPQEMAARFFQNAAIGTSVVIRQEAPQDYGREPLVGERYTQLASITER